jgi:hypothetical protein
LPADLLIFKDGTIMFFKVRNSKWIRLLTGLFFIIGLLLLGVNIFGLFKSLRNDALYSEVTPYKNDISISLKDARKQWHRKEGETEKDFAMRMNMLVNHAMAHYWKDEGINKYHLRVPVWENYILYFMGFIKPVEYGKYEFRTYKKAIERGVGICSQPSIALKDLLNENGIAADLWDIAGHVVVRATFSDGSGYILDPDYGQYVPFDIPDIERNPEIVRPYYADQNEVYAPHLKKHRTTDSLVELYGKEGNHIYYMDRSFEKFSYIAKWVLPFLLMLPLLIFKKR